MIATPARIGVIAVRAFARALLAIMGLVAAANIGWVPPELASMLGSHGWTAVRLPRGPASPHRP